MYKPEFAQQNETDKMLRDLEIQKDSQYLYFHYEGSRPENDSNEHDSTFSRAPEQKLNNQML